MADDNFHITFPYTCIAENCQQPYNRNDTDVASSFPFICMNILFCSRNHLKKMKDLFGVFENRTRASKLDIKQLHQNGKKGIERGKRKEKLLVLK